MSAPGAPEPVDLDALMEGIRRRVAEKKAQGMYGVDALMAGAGEDADEPFGMDELEQLRELAVQRVDLDVAQSTKPVLGAAVSRVKRLLVRGASQPMYGMSAQATAFNAALLAYLAALARQVAALERSAAADRAAADAARDEAQALRDELARALATVDEARAQVARLADAALPERVARLERGPADGAPATPPTAHPGGAGSLRLRLEATEDDPGRAARLAAHREALGDGRVLHAGAGSGWALEALGPRAEGVEADGELAAAAAAEGRPVRHADPVAYLGALAPGSLDGVLVTGLVERLDGAGLAALATSAARAVAPGGLVIVEGLDPEAARDPGFWRDPDRLRPVHPDAVRMALEGAGLGDVTVSRDGAHDGGPPRYAVHARP